MFQNLLLQLEKRVFEETLDLPTRAHLRAKGIDHIELSSHDLADLLGGSYGRWHNLLHNNAAPTATEIMVMRTALSDGFQAAKGRHDVVRNAKNGDHNIGARKKIVLRRDGVAPVPYSYEIEINNELDGVFGHRKRNIKVL